MPRKKKEEKDEVVLEESNLQVEETAEEPAETPAEEEAAETVEETVEETAEEPAEDSGQAHVYVNRQRVRTYTLADNGENYRALAEEYAGKIGGDVR